MNKKKSLAAGLIALSLPLMMLAISSPGANAASVQSSVDAIDHCKWQIAGAPEVIALSSETKYEGAALTVSDTLEDITIGISGSLEPQTAISGESKDCSFYNNRETAAVTFALEGQANFDAEFGPGETKTPDTDMNFDLSTENTLDVITDISACTDFDATDINFSALTEATTAFGIANTNIDNKYVGSASGSERCNPTITVSVDIKASTKVPKGAGQNYSFSGPSLIINLDPVNVGQ